MARGAYSALPPGVPPSVRRTIAEAVVVAVPLALLQRNVLNSQQWGTREDLRYAIVHWIEHTYNRRRRQRGLGRLTSVELELAFSDNADQAAA